MTRQYETHAEYQLAYDEAVREWKVAEAAYHEAVRQYGPETPEADKLGKRMGRLHYNISVVEKRGYKKW
jgi:hypothetical protein